MKMTSKEALDELKASTEWTWKDSENYDIVKNDLEVLDIIKKYWSIEINNSQVCISYKTTSPMGLLPIDEISKLKEWMENE